MGLYNFKKRFVPYVLDGSKTHTIRAPRAHQDKPGDLMHLYTGLRQKGTQLLGRFPCKKVEGIFIAQQEASMFVVYVEGMRLAADECNALAWRDGFRNNGRNGAFAEMMEFWAGRLPFCGQVYHWDPRGLQSNPPTGVKERGI